jgi:hypothetical protein
LSNSNLSHNFKSEPFTEETLYDALSDNKRFSASEVANHPRARYLYGYLKDIQTRTLVVEKEYVDGDYLEDFVAFYSTCFQGYKRFCKRIHFFDITLTDDELLKFIYGELLELDEKRIKSSYLGFLIARPLPKAVIGRTVLKTYDHEKNFGCRYYTAVRKYTANFFGIDLVIEQSLAFQEQDKAVAACATVALWSAFHKSAKLFGTPAPRPAVITRNANQIVRDARLMPSPGLSIDQICHAIRLVGLEPETFDITKNTPLISIIYGYLQMGLPIILIAEVAQQGSTRPKEIQPEQNSLGLLHAITLTGFSLRNDSCTCRDSIFDNNKRTYIDTKGKYIDELYGHDDQYGPFCRMFVKPQFDLGKRTSSIVLEMPNNRLYMPKQLIIPIYNKIRVSCANIITIVAGLGNFLKIILGDGEETQIEWDIHLTQINDYKKQLRVSNDNGKYNFLLLRSHPKFIWRIILIYKENTTLELLSDATEMPGAFSIYELFWHDEEFKNIIHYLMEITQENPEMANLRDSILKKDLIRLLTQ